MNGNELVLSQDVMLLTIVILCFIGLVAVPIHGLIIGKRALDRGYIRVVSVGSAESFEQNEEII